MNIKEEMLAVVETHGPWTAYNIKLADGVETAPEFSGPLFRLRRSVQIISDLTNKPWKDLRILDLACLEGIYAIEFALQGAQVVGIEGREASTARARFAAKALGVFNVEFYTDDVRNLSVEKYGTFDVIFCSGILYHLGAADGCAFVKSMADACNNLLIVDTHVGLDGKSTVVVDGKTYCGTTAWEHSAKDSEKTKQARTWSSLDNNTAFWITEPSLINLLTHVGFTSVIKILAPQSSVQSSDRLTFAAVKGKSQKIILSPELENFPDNDLPEKSTLKPHPYQSSGSPLGHFLMRVRRRLARTAGRGAGAYVREAGHKK
jgi:SAM-dependent methyltransferase